VKSLIESSLFQYLEFSYKYFFALLYFLEFVSEGIFVSLICPCFLMRFLLFNRMFCLFIANTTLAELITPLLRSTYFYMKSLFFSRISLRVESRDSSVGVVTRPRDIRPWNPGSFPAGVRFFYLIQKSAMALRPTPPAIKRARGHLSVEIKRPHSEADHLPPSRGKVNACRYTSAVPYAFMARKGTALSLPYLRMI
jgi:hypothetical protein